MNDYRAVCRINSAQLMLFLFRDLYPEFLNEEDHIPVILFYLFLAYPVHGKWHLALTSVFSPARRIVSNETP